MFCMQRNYKKYLLVALLVLLAAVLSGAPEGPAAHAQDSATEWIESDDPRVAASEGWTSVTDPAASGSAYLQADDPAASLALVTDGGALEVWYLAAPGGGTFAIEVDGTVLRTVSTHGDAGRARARVDYLDARPHQLRVYPVEGLVAIDAFNVLPAASPAVRDGHGSETTITPGAPSGTTHTRTPTYTWMDTVVGEWYRLRVTDGSTDYLYDWFQVGTDVTCVADACQITPATAVGSGTGTTSLTWYVQSWTQATGPSPWTDGTTFQTTPPTLTNPGGNSIVLDGVADEWTGHGAVASDPTGDSVSGELDFTGGAAFLTDAALGLMASVDDPGAPFQQFDFMIDMGTSQYLISWAPGQSDGYINDVTDEFTPIGPTQYSTFGYDSALEARIDRRDLNNPTTIELQQIRAMYGDPNWHAADEISYPANLPTLDIAFEEPPVEHTTHLEPENGWWADYRLRHDMQTAWGAAYGPDGNVYFANWLGSDIVRVLPDGTLEPLELWRQEQSFIQGGGGPIDVAFAPDDTLYFATHAHIYKIVNDEVVLHYAPNPGEIGGIVFDASGTLYYNTFSSGKIMRLNGDGSVSEVATPGGRLLSMAFGLDGRLYVAVVTEEKLVAVDVDTGDVTDFFVISGAIADPMFVTVDVDGDLWMRSTTWLYQIGPDGSEKEYYYDGQLMTDGGVMYSTMDLSTAGGIAFDEQGHLWIGSYDSGVFRLDPSDTHAQVMNTTADVYDCANTSCTSLGQATVGTRLASSSSVGGEILSGSPVWHVVDYGGTTGYVHTAWTDSVQDSANWTRTNMDPGHTFSDMEAASDGTIYAFTVNPTPRGELWEIAPNGTITVLATFADLQGSNMEKNVGMAFDEAAGYLYLGMPWGEILRYDLTTGATSHYANLRARRMTIAGDGHLYVTDGEWNHTHRLIRVTGVDTYIVVTDTIDGTTMQLSEVPLDTAPDGTLVLLIPETGNLYSVDHLTGQATMITNFMEAGTTPPCPITVDSEGGIWGTLHSHYLLRYWAPGATEWVTPSSTGADPLALEASVDGPWIYVSDSGALSRVAPADAFDDEEPSDAFDLPTYEWDDIDGIASWNIYLGGPGGMVYDEWYLDADVCDGDTCSHQPYGLDYTLNDGTYTWYLRAWSEAEGYSPWGSRSFSVANHSPDKVTTIRDPLELDTRRPRFDFDAPLGATWFRFYVADTAGTKIWDQWVTRPDACGALEATTCTLARIPHDLVDGTTYKLWIQTWGPAGTGPWSDAYLFTVDVPAPSLPDGLVMSANDGDPHFAWNDQDTATWYQLVVIDSTGASLHNQWYERDPICDGATCGVLPGVHPPNGSVTWYVRAWSPGGYSTGGENGFARADDTLSTSVPAAPTGLQSIPGGLVTDRDTLTYTWDEGGAAYYRLRVTDATSGVVITDAWYRRQTDLDGCPGGTCSLALSDVYLGNGTYDIDVLGWTPSGSGPWSAPVSVTIAAPSPVIPVQTAPIADAIVDTDQPVLAWDGASGMSWYNLYVAAGSTVYLNEWRRAETLDCSAGDTTCVFDAADWDTVVLPNGNYRWCVQSYSPAGASSASTAEETFEVAIPVPAAPASGRTPADGAMVTTATVTFTWEPVDYALWYNVQIHDPDSTLVVDQWFQAETCGPSTCSAEIAVPHGHYTWQLRSWNRTDYGPFGAAWTLHVLN